MVNGRVYCKINKWLKKLLHNLLIEIRGHNKKYLNVHNINKTNWTKLIRLLLLNLDNTISLIINHSKSS